jgi:polynucleotide 5'-hydroxyl-kinase GRC3/NOL9
MTLDTPPGWQEALDSIVAAGGVCMVVGRVDSGKTTLCSALAAHALERGRRAAIVDADAGQSDIGPPAAVGMAIIKQARQLEDLESIPADALAFVGATSPGRYLLQLCAGAREMVEAACDRGAELVIVDTTGLVDGAIGRHLKAAKVALLRPRHLVGLQMRDEVEHLLRPYRKRDEPAVYRLRQSRRVHRRDRDQRKAKRERQFAAYFADAADHDIAWDDVGLEQTAWLTGKRVPGHLAAYVEEVVGAEALHVERIESGLFAIVKDMKGAARQSFEGEESDISAVSAELLDNLLIGLIDGLGRTLALGILSGVDFRQRRFAIATPLKSVAEVRALRLGSLRVSREGIELGHGEIA